jgi:lipoprotein
MVQNHERLNPSDSKLPEKIMALIGAVAFSIGAAGCNGETHSKPTPDTTTSTAQETQNPTSTLSPTPSPEASTTKAEKNIPQEIIDKYKDINLSDIRGLLEKEKSGEEVSYSEWRATFTKTVNENFIPEANRIPADKYENVYTNQDNLAKDLSPVIENNIIGILALGSIRQDSVEHGYPFSKEEMKIIDKGVFNTITVAQAKSLLSSLTVYNKNDHVPNIFDIEDITDITVEVIFESTGKNYRGEEIPYTYYTSDPYEKGTQNHCSVGKSIARCMETEAGVDLGPNKSPSGTGSIYEANTIEISKIYKISFKNTDGEQRSVLFVVRTFVNGDTDPNNLNVPGTQQVSSDLHGVDFTDVGKGIYMTPVIAGFAVLSDSNMNIPFLQEAGVNVAPSSIPKVAEAIENRNR